MPVSSMRIFDIEEAQTHLSRLIEQAVEGEPFVIAKAGKPLVKVVPVDAADIGAAPRIGFPAGEIVVPDDFDHMGQGEIETLFGGKA
jgi:prevent-host-death family protein